MNERQSAEISIRRRNGNAVETIVTVPITGDCTRRFYLMREDYIKLKFSLATPVTFAVGDYIEDELFGTFYLTDKQSPTFNEAGGCYVYELQFNAYYMAWKNRLAMLTTTASGTRIRKETNWILTDTLAKHAQEICNNLSVLGYTYGTPPAPFTYLVENTAIHAQEATTIAYNGVDIISALNAVADAFKCEWWVRGSVIHFGKCETDTGSPFVFSLEAGNGYGANMVAVTPQRNDAVYANKVYFFGGTQNVPETYGKTLKFKVTDRIQFAPGASGSSAYIYLDSTRKITPDMFALTGDAVALAFEDGVTYLSPSAIAYQTAAFVQPKDYQYAIEISKLAFSVDVEAEDEPEYGYDHYNISWAAKIILVNVTDGTTTDLWEAGGSTPMEWESDTDLWKVSVGSLATGLSFGGVTTTSKTYRLQLQIQVTDSHGNASEIVGSSLEADAGAASLNATVIYAECGLVYGGNTYKVRFNPYHLPASDERYYGFYFISNFGQQSADPPSGFGVGSDYTLDFSLTGSDDIDETKVPVSFWSSDYSDPNSLLKIGENRLRLPATTPGYLVAASAQDNDDTVEKVVIFEQVYPKCTLFVSAIKETERKDTEEASDKSKTYWNWTQYTLSATLAGGVAFPFKKNYIQGGETLQVRFLTPSEAGLTDYSGNGCKLAGMTFDVSFGTEDGEPRYTLVRNGNYGAKLPNETLRPTVGDPFVLLGWKVTALSALGLVNQAEQELLTLGQSYMAALEEDNFIFRCRMFSDSMYALQAMPDFGRSIVIKYALTGDKTTRVLGYTFRLDRPWNTPEYEVGETDAYSRIKQLEDKMRAGGVSVSGVKSETVSVSQDAAGAEVDLSDYLTVGEADQLYERKGAGSPVWGNIQDKPTTIAGYGITDAYTKSEADALNFFERYSQDNGLTYSIRLKPQYAGLWADGFLSGGGIYSNGGGGGGVSYLRLLLDVYHNNSGIILRSDGTTTVQNGDVLAYDSSNSRWYAKAENQGGGGTVTSVGLSAGIGLAISGTPNPITSSGTFTVGVASGYKLPTTSEWNGKQDVISDLESIRSNAEAGAAKVSNVQSDWNATSGLARILNKPEIPSVYDALLTIRMNGESIGTFSANASTNKTIDLGTVLTSFTETDPVFSASPAAGITAEMIQSWTNKQEPLTAGTDYLTPQTIALLYQPKVSALGSKTRPVYISSPGTFTRADTYAGGTKVALNGTDKGAGTASFYAPTSSGINTSQYLRSGGPLLAPVWSSPGNITEQEGGLVTGATVYAALQNYARNNAVVHLDGDETIDGDKTFIGNVEVIGWDYLLSTIEGETLASALAAKADTSDLGDYLPLTGGTLTGDLYLSSGCKLNLDPSGDKFLRYTASVSALYFNNSGGDTYFISDSNYIYGGLYPLPTNNVKPNLGSGNWFWGNTYTENVVLPKAGQLRLDVNGDAYITRGSGTDYSLYIVAGHEADGTTGANMYLSAANVCPNNLGTNLGSGFRYWNNLYAKRWYPDPANAPTAYIEYVSGNPGYFRVHGNIVADGQVSAGGIFSNS